MKCPKCGHEAEAQSEQCAACGVYFHKVAAQAGRPKPTIRRKRTPSALEQRIGNAVKAVMDSRARRASRPRKAPSFLRRLLLILVVTPIVVTSCISYIERRDGPSETRRKQPAANQCGSDFYALLMSQRVIERRLRAPASAKYPKLRDRDVFVAETGECTYLVRSYVDSQNVFGAMIRERYTAEMRYSPDTDTWRALSIEHH